MNAELDKGIFAEAKEIAEDIIQNLEKINHHGKRADAIVKGMLQHSRTAAGKKNPPTSTHLPMNICVFPTTDFVQKTNRLMPILGWKQMRICLKSMSFHRTLAGFC